MFGPKKIKCASPCQVLGIDLPPIVGGFDALAIRTRQCGELSVRLSVACPSLETL